MIGESDGGGGQQEERGRIKGGEGMGEGWGLICLDAQKCVFEEGEMTEIVENALFI